MPEPERFDWPEMMKVAHAAGLPIDAVWDLTPGELSLIAEAENEKRERELDLVAMHAAWIMNCWTKKRVTPDKLLGRSRSVDMSRFKSIKEAIEDAKKSEGDG